MSSIPKTTSKITILLLLSSRFYFCLCDDDDVYTPTYTHIHTYICSKRLYLKLGKTPEAFILNVCLFMICQRQYTKMIACIFSMCLQKLYLLLLYNIYENEGLDVNKILGFIFQSEQKHVLSSPYSRS